MSKEHTNNNPLVTVVTPSYNQGKFIEETILSVLNQTYKNIQYVVIDGGSNDETMTVVEKYRDRIDIVVHERDKGQSDAINKGFKLATGELVGWINSDDILYPDCVERIVALYNQKPDGAIYYNCQNDFIDKDSKIIQTYKKKIPDKHFLINHHYSIIQQGSFYKTNFVKEIGYLDESLHFCMDLDLWLKLLDKGPIYYINDNISSTGFRLWGDAKTSTAGSKFQHDILRVLNRNGMNYFSKNHRKLRWQLMKIYVKKILIPRNS